MGARADHALAAAGDAAREAGRWLRGAPGTLVWLGILLVTEVVSGRLSPEALHDVLGARSTNLDHLASDPLHVLVVSAFWLAGGTWLSYAVLFLVFVATTERWLGTRRWLVVLATAHVVATYVSQGILYLWIQVGREPASEAHTLDYGVSYALAGCQAVLTWHVARPWRWGYLAVLLAVYTVPLLADVDFTDAGHLTAALLGLALYPLTRGIGEPWDPRRTWRRLRSPTTGVPPA